MATDTDPRVVLFDDNYGYRQVDKVSCDSEFDWFYDADATPDRIYVFSDDGAPADPDTNYTSPGIEYADSTIAPIVLIDGITWVNIDGLLINHGYSTCVQLLNVTNNINITNTVVEECHNKGISGAAADAITDILIEDVTTRRNGVNGIYLDDLNVDWTIRRWTSLRDGIVAGTWQEWAGSHDYGAGLKVWTLDSVSSPDAMGIVIEYSKVSYAGIRDDAENMGNNKGHGIWIDENYATNINTGVVVRYNLTHDNGDAGLYSEKTQFSKWYGNISHSNGDQGLRMGTDDNTKVHQGNLYYNMTLYGNTDEGIYAYGAVGGGEVFVDNIIKNLIIDGSGSWEFKAENGAANDDSLGSGNVYESNNFGVEYGNFLYWDADQYSTYDTFWDAASQTGNNVETACMNDPGNDDFTLAVGDGCIDAGANVGYQKLRNDTVIGDFGNGNTLETVPVGNRSDIGSMEFSIWGAP
jgi:hypothetical protein